MAVMLLAWAVRSAGVSCGRPDPAAGKRRPGILAAPSHVPQVSIQTPGAAGVSRSACIRFGAQAQGAVPGCRRARRLDAAGRLDAGESLAGGVRVLPGEVDSAWPGRCAQVAELLVG